jgi:hypothetical protein
MAADTDGRYDSPSSDANLPHRKKSAFMPVADRPGPRFQFSLRWLLIVVTLAAILFGLSALVGDWFFPTFIFVLFPTPLIVAIIHARGEIRTFAIGGLIPWVYLSISAWGSGNLAMQFETLILLLFLASASGALAVGTRRWIERNGYGNGR